MRLKEIFQFLDCPLKLKYGKEHPTKSTFKVEIFDSFLMSCLLHKAKTNSLTLKSSMNSFNSLWDSTKKLYETADIDVSKEKLVDIAFKATYLVEYLNTIGEIIILSDKYSIPIDNEVIESSITSVSRTDDGMFHFIYVYTGSQYFYNDAQLIPVLLKYISKSYLKELSDSKYCIHIYKPQTGKFYTFYEDIDMRKIKPIIHNLVSSITLTKPYPNNSIGICMRCEFKSNCEWNVE